MSGKPITTDVNPAPASAPAPPDGAATAGLLSDLRAGSEEASALGDLSSLPSRPKRRVSMQTMVLLLVLTGSALALFMMRRQGMKGGMKFNTPTIAHELEKPSASVSTELQIWADLAKSGMPQRDAASRLQKNPFMLDTPAGEATGPGGTVRDSDAERQAMIKQKLGGIRLNSVLDGSVPVARVNDKLVRVGDIIEDIFLVAQIHDRSIDLIADGHTYSLNMGDGAVGGSNTVKKNPKTPAPAPQTPRR